MSAGFCVFHVTFSFDIILCYTKHAEEKRITIAVLNATATNKA